MTKSVERAVNLFFLPLQNVDDSKAFFKRKIEFLTKQIEKIQPVLQEKHAMKQGKPGLTSPNGLISSDCIFKMHLLAIYFALYRILSAVELWWDFVKIIKNEITEITEYLHITVLKWCFHFSFDFSCLII